MMMPSVDYWWIALCNPPDEYRNTRHNVAADFFQTLTQNWVRAHPRIPSKKSQIQWDHRSINLLYLTSSLMNISGLGVSSLIQYYQADLRRVWIVHDELDLPIGTVRFKRGGGHAGHRGLIDVIRHLGTHDFGRIRIGIGRPEGAEQVSHYVLSKPSALEQAALTLSFDQIISKWRCMNVESS